MQQEALEIKNMISRSKQAAKFDMLMYKDPTSYIPGEYPSQSEADLGLMGLLYWWSRGDRMLCEQIFVSSKLGQREKWHKRQDYRDGIWNRVDDGNYRSEFTIRKPEDMPPILCLERKPDIINSAIEDESGIVPGSAKLNADGVSTLSIIDEHGEVITDVLFIDYICELYGFPKLATWKRNATGGFLKKDSRLAWVRLNNFAAVFVGNTGGWGNKKELPGWNDIQDQVELRHIKTAQKAWAVIS